METSRKLILCYAKSFLTFSVSAKFRFTHYFKVLFFISWFYCHVSLVSGLCEFFPIILMLHLNRFVDGRTIDLLENLMQTLNIFVAFEDTNSDLHVIENQCLLWLID